MRHLLIGVTIGTIILALLYFISCMHSDISDIKESLNTIEFINLETYESSILAENKD